MYQELWFDSATASQTSSEYPAADTPLFYFNDTVQRVKAAKVLEVVFPQSFYNFTSYPLSFNGTTPSNTTVDGVLIQAPRGHQSWRLQMYNPVTTATADLALPAGGGTALEFVDYMNTTVFGTQFATFQTTFNTLTGLTLSAASITYNVGAETLSWKFTVTTDQGVNTPCKFAIVFSEMQAGYGRPFAAASLGFPLQQNVFKNQNFDITYTSQFCNGNPFNYVTLHSRTIGNFFKINPNTSVTSNVYNYNVQGGTDAVAIVPLEGGFTSITRWVDPDPTSKFAELQSNLDRIDFYLTLGPYINVPLNLNGQSFQVKLGIITDDGDYEVYKRARYV